MNPFDRIDQLTKEKRSMEIAALKLADDYDALKSDLARMTAEREECRAFWTAEADKAATRTTELVRNSAYWEAEATALRARVAEQSAAPLPMREDPRYRGTDFRSAIDVNRASQEGSK